jgi:hypothetical protein
VGPGDGNAAVDQAVGFKVAARSAKGVSRQVGDPFVKKGLLLFELVLANVGSSPAWISVQGRGLPVTRCASSRSFLELGRSQSSDC